MGTIVKKESLVFPNTDCVADLLEELIGYLVVYFESHNIPHCMPSYTSILDGDKKIIGIEAKLFDGQMFRVTLSGCHYDGINTSLPIQQTIIIEKI